MSPERPGKQPNPNIEPIPQGALDSELAAFLIGHIDNPCTVKVSPDEERDIRDFYLREAERAMSRMTNVDAIRALNTKIEEYKK